MTSPVFAQAIQQNEVLVGTRVAPPFVMKTADGRWEGISIELAEYIAEQMDVSITWRETPLNEIISGVERGELDLAIAAMSITSERAERVSFSHPYYRTGLGVAVADPPWNGAVATLRALTSREFILTIGLMSLLAFTAGALVWRFERKRNSKHFSDRAGPGLGSGFWWAAVTMTTVGYGDKTPVTFAGRMVATFWMFAALILTGVFTAQLSASLLNQGRAEEISHQDDLVEETVGIVMGAASQEPVRNLGANAVEFADVPAGLAALKRGEIGAFIHDYPILIWYSKGQPGVRVTDLVLELWDYGVVMPRGSEYLDELNIEILQLLESEDWKVIERRYLGHQSGQSLR